MVEERALGLLELRFFQLAETYLDVWQPVGGDNSAAVASLVAYDDPFKWLMLILQLLVEKSLLC